MSNDRPDPLAPPDGYGQRRPTGPPRQANAPLPADTLCAADRESPSSPPVCTREYEFVWVFADVAEHVQEVELCREHSDQMAADLSCGAGVRCTQCRNRCRLEQVTGRATGQDAGYLRIIESARSSLVQAALNRLAAS